MHVASKWTCTVHGCLHRIMNGCMHNAVQHVIMPRHDGFVNATLSYLKEDGEVPKAMLDEEIPNSSMIIGVKLGVEILAFGSKLDYFTKATRV